MRQTGVVNKILSVFGFPADFAWLGNTKTAIWTLIILAVWQFGSSMLIFLSALKQIPSELYEAADVDGANKFNKFFKITLPLLTPTIFFNLVMQMITHSLPLPSALLLHRENLWIRLRFYTVYTYFQSFKILQHRIRRSLAWVTPALSG